MLQDGTSGTIARARMFAGMALAQTILWLYLALCVGASFGYVLGAAMSAHKHDRPF